MSLISSILTSLKKIKNLFIIADKTHIIQKKHLGSGFRELTEKGVPPDK
jgi:TolB-like protein